MERFAIKIDKSVKARLKNLCRLCGIDNPNQIEILNAAEWIDLTVEGEVSLKSKIAECVGIEVMKNDRMPQKICALCIDKINDFFEFREMCQATNIQTRKLLNLPDVTKVKTPKKVTIKTEEEDAVESIFGISGSEVKRKAEQVQKASKKAKKGATTSTDDSARFRGMTKREIEITLELERIKKEEEEAQTPKQIANTSVNRTKNGRKKKEKATADVALLAPKEPNQRERKRELEQKRIEKKRKTDTKVKTPLPKKIKKEPGISCSICELRFEKVALRDAHLLFMHRPMIEDYGCSSCQEQFPNLNEMTAHSDWHCKSNVPYRCVICRATFQKLITFQKHSSKCSHPSFSLTAPFASNIYCSICRLEFETQNLYDWHNCFISDNSPCPQCSRIFVKRTVLLKHMFKCAGPPGLTPVVPKAKLKGKAKKKAAKTSQKTKNQPNTTSQNSFKLEPETIIETNIDGDEAFDAIDNSYMDTHFADSDNEFEPMNSIIPTTEQSITTTEQTNDETISTNVTNDVPIQENLNHPLLECRVKLEPLDVSSLTSPVTVNPEVRPQLTVPPLTIRIKKEVIRSGYEDDFDMVFARNIKQERVDETYELASTSASSSSSTMPNRGAHKSSNNHKKHKKLYKKPALLAIKIKQEKMERETTDDEYSHCYSDYSLPSDNYQPTLPIITQIHSVIEPSSIGSIPIEPSNNLQIPIVTNEIDKSQETNIAPFMPIRIKSEFHRPISPPVNIEAAQQIEENLAPANITDFVESTMTSDIAINEICSQETEIKEIENKEIENKEPVNEEPVNELIANSEEPTTEMISIEPQQMECETSISSNVEMNLQVNAPIDSCITDAVQTAEEKSETESNIIVEISTPQLFSTENMLIESNLDEHCMEKDKIFVPEIQKTPDAQQLENGQCDEQMVSASEITNVLGILDTNLIEDIQNIDTASEHSINSIEKHLESFSTGSLGVEQSEQLLQPIEPQICDDNIGIDTDVTNDTSNISPIDFIEPITNDDSLNFIDQLVHEVADTIAAQTDNDDGKGTLQNESITIVEPNQSIDGVNLNNSVGCSIENVIEQCFDIHNEFNSNPIDSTDKPIPNDNLLTLSDIDEDLLPVLNAMDTKSNGNNSNTSSIDTNPIENENIPI